MNQSQKKPYGDSGSVTHLERTQRATIRLWPDAGRMLGIGRAAAYEAAKRGEIPVLRIGRRLLVPRLALDKLLRDPKTAA